MPKPPEIAPQTLAKGFPVFFFAYLCTFCTKEHGTASGKKAPHENKTAKRIIHD